MPNHVTTEIEGHPEVLASLLTPDGGIDFGRLIPEPENIEKGGCSGNHPPGVVCWYEWNTANWGTKWNAYQCEVTPGRLRFNTAWSHPFPVIREMARRHPEATLIIRYADEDLGHNCGRYTITGDEVVEGEIKDPRNFASQLKHGVSYAEYYGDDEE